MNLWACDKDLLEDKPSSLSDLEEIFIILMIAKPTTEDLMATAIQTVR